MDVPSASEVSSALSSSIVGQENVTNARRAPKSRQGCQRCKTKRVRLAYQEHNNLSNDMRAVEM